MLNSPSKLRVLRRETTCFLSLLPSRKVLTHFRTSALTHFFFALLLFLSPLISHADTQGDYTYTVSDGKATITGFNASYSGPLSVPATLGSNPSYPVTTIGDWAFSDCRALASVTLPDSVTIVGDSAFSVCSGLTSVLFQGSPPSLGGSDVLFPIDCQSGGCRLAALAAKRAVLLRNKMEVRIRSTKGRK